MLNNALDDYLNQPDYLEFKKLFEEYNRLRKVLPAIEILNKTKEESNKIYTQLVKSCSQSKLLYKTINVIDLIWDEINNLSSYAQPLTQAPKKYVVIANNDFEEETNDHILPPNLKNVLLTRDLHSALMDYDLILNIYYDIKFFSQDINDNFLKNHLRIIKKSKMINYYLISTKNIESITVYLGLGSVVNGKTFEKINEYIH